MSNTRSLSLLWPSLVVSEAQVLEIPGEEGKETCENEPI